MMHGVLPGDIAEVVQQFRESKIDYMQKLRRYLTLHSGGETRWLTPARLFVWQKMYLPNHNNPVLEAILAIDTSGSTQGYLEKFFGDTLNIMRQFGKFHLTVIQCDEEITEVREYTKNSRVPQSIQAKGGGGTSFIPVFEYVKQKKLQPRVMLYFTDGSGDVPEKAPDYPVIWVLTPNGQPPAIGARSFNFLAMKQAGKVRQKIHQKKLLSCIFGGGYIITFRINGDFGTVKTLPRM